MSIAPGNIRDLLATLPAQYSHRANEYITAGETVRMFLATQMPLRGQPQVAHAARTLAFQNMLIPYPSRTGIVRAVFTVQFMRLLVQRISARCELWQVLLVALWNGPSVEGGLLVQDLIDVGIVDVLLPIAQKRTDDWHVRGPSGSCAFDVSLGLFATMADRGGDSIATQLQDILPVMCECMRELPMDVDEPTLSYMLSFRTVCILAPVGHSYISDEERALPWLLIELECGLNHEATPDGNLLPDAWARLATITRIARDVRGRAALVRAGVVSLLGRAVASAHEEEKNTSLQWCNAVEALHLFATTRDHHNEIVSCRAAVDGLLAIAGGRGDLPMRTKFLAADAAIALGVRWDIERLMWSAALKGDGRHCPLATLPVQLIRPILAWVMLLEADNRDAPAMVPNPRLALGFSW